MPANIEYIGNQTIQLTLDYNIVYCNIIIEAEKWTMRSSYDKYCKSAESRLSLIENSVVN